MEEFLIAHAKAMDGRKNFVIVILKEKPNLSEVPRELAAYLRTKTYIDGTKHWTQVTKQLRYSLVRNMHGESSHCIVQCRTVRDHTVLFRYMLPRVPLRQLGSASTVPRDRFLPQRLAQDPAETDDQSESAYGSGYNSGSDQGFVRNVCFCLCGLSLCSANPPL